jgi:hypothetical protein
MSSFCRRVIIILLGLILAGNSAGEGLFNKGGALGFDIPFNQDGGLSIDKPFDKGGGLSIEKPLNNGGGFLGSAGELRENNSFLRCPFGC